MNYAALTLGLAFAVIAMVVLRIKSTEPVVANNKRLLATLFFVASAAFFVAFAISAVNSGGAR